MPKDFDPPPTAAQIRQAKEAFAPFRGEYEPYTDGTGRLRHRFHVWGYLADERFGELPAEAFGIGLLVGGQRGTGGATGHGDGSCRRDFGQAPILPFPAPKSHQLPRRSPDIRVMRGIGWLDERHSASLAPSGEQHQPPGRPMEKRPKKDTDAIKLSVLGAVSLRIPTAPFLKLWDTAAGWLDAASEFVGTLIDLPGMRARSAARTQNDVKLIGLEGVRDRKLFKLDADSQFERAIARVYERERDRQENIEAVFVEAAKALPTNGEQPNAEAVGKDWKARFVGDCQDVSDQDMRVLYGRILAGEVMRPGSFSLLALSVVRVLSKRDAELFTRLCSCVWLIKYDGPQIILPRVGGPIRVGSPTPQFGPTYPELVQLDSLGLIRQESHDLHLTFHPTQEDECQAEYYGSRFGRTAGNGFSITTGPVILTSAGQELYYVAGGVPDEEYRHWAVGLLTAHGFTPPEVVAH